MNSEAHPVLLFDVMDTLVTDPFHVDLPAFFGLSLDEYLAAKHPTSWIEFEQGRIDEREYLSRCFQDGRFVDREGLRNCLRRSYEWLDGAEALLVELADRGFEMHALSNYPVWYELIEAKLGLSRYMQWSFVSWKTGIRKPSPAAYDQAAAWLQRPADQCLFIDDRPINVDAARAAGMDAILARGCEGVRTSLVGRGLLER